MPKGRLSRNFEVFVEVGTTGLMEIWVKRMIVLLVIATVAIAIFHVFSK